MLWIQAWITNSIVLPLIRQARNRIRNIKIVNNADGTSTFTDSEGVNLVTGSDLLPSKVQASKLGLYVNGSGFLGSNKNSARAVFTRDKAVDFNAYGSFTKTGYLPFVGDAPIPINPSGKYEFSYDLIISPDDVGRTWYQYTEFYDADNKSINSFQANDYLDGLSLDVNGTPTPRTAENFIATITQDYVEGSGELHVDKNGANIIALSASIYPAYNYQRLKIMNYISANGVSYGEIGYSRDATGYSAHTEDVAGTTDTLIKYTTPAMLDTAKDVLKVGRTVGIGYVGGTYLYTNALVNVSYTRNDGTKVVDQPFHAFKVPSDIDPDYPINIKWVLEGASGWTVGKFAKGTSACTIGFLASYGQPHTEAHRWWVSNIQVRLLD